MFWLWAWAAAAAHLCACTAAGTIIGGSADDASLASDTGLASAPKPPPGLLQVIQAKGSVMHSPTLQAITFNTDPNAAAYENFIAALPTSSYWRETTAEYGVGAASAAPPQRAAIAAAQKLTAGALVRGEASDIEAFMLAQLDSPHAPAGAPPGETLYILFTPPGASVSFDSNTATGSCANGVLAWHTAMWLPQTQASIAYVVVPDCGEQNGFSAVDSRTAAASHAIIEAATDPRMDAYGAFDANHIPWQLPAGGAEVGAACVAALYGDPNLFVVPADLPFLVQRTWSNARAALGHAPCVPAPSPQNAPYFDSVPQLSAQVTLPLGQNLIDPNLTMAGVKLPANLSATVPLQLYSDAMISTPWTLTVTEMGTSQLTVSTDKSAGLAGDTILLSLLARSGARGQSLLRVTSTLGTDQHSQYIIVAH